MPPKSLARLTAISIQSMKEDEMLINRYLLCENNRIELLSPSHKMSSKEEETDAQWCKNIQFVFEARERNSTSSHELEDAAYFPQCFVAHLLAHGHRSVSQPVTPRQDACRSRKIISDERDEVFWSSRIAHVNRETSALDVARKRAALRESTVESKALECTRELQEMIEHIRLQNRAMNDAAHQLQTSRLLSASLVP